MLQDVDHSQKCPKYQADIKQFYRVDQLPFFSTLAVMSWEIKVKHRLKGTEHRQCQKPKSNQSFNSNWSRKSCSGPGKWMQIEQGLWVKASHNFSLASTSSDFTRLCKCKGCHLPPVSNSVFNKIPTYSHWKASGNYNCVRRQDFITWWMS
jgi:hypothetical protein